MQRDVHIIGGGLAGTEAALLLADAGIDVVLHEQKPQRRSPAHKEDGLAELVCSNSMRSDNPHNAIGLLHEELRRLGSPVLAQADRARVPAGDALAVDRVKFSSGLTAQVREHPRLRVASGEVRDLPSAPDLCIVATGPLTGEELARSLAQAVGASQLAFYDAIAPIVAGDSVDRSIAFAQSRYGKGEGADYLNLPLARDEYERFVDELLRGQKVAPHAFEEARYFEGCLPIEVMAERGRDTLAFGPMKPVGLTDPHTGKRPHAVVQLRREDKAGTAWNLVGFQTRLTWPEQKRIFSECIPGLRAATFLRLGQVHRNDGSWRSTVTWYASRALPWHLPHRSDPLEPACDHTAVSDSRRAAPAEPASGASFSTSSTVHRRPPGPSTSDCSATAVMVKAGCDGPAADGDRG